MLGVVVGHEARRLGQAGHVVGEGGGGVVVVEVGGPDVDPTALALVVGCLELVWIKPLNFDLQERDCSLSSRDDSQGRPSGGSSSPSRPPPPSRPS